ncbi:glycosyl transferase [Luteolibacter luteus]|uniref:Glycosyl transferase n=1 Tax=Luteolibacter luteus TaxID=2728835 RepID=A0A858RC37_9BACT|nr:glycosyl transferase [Luteolibacter luteus]QJE94282.1 glycosyl transferase [Luteolibacter luteus]
MKPLLSSLKTTLYRRPKDEIQRMLRWGPRAYLLCDQWAKQMEDSVSLLTPQDEAGKTGKEVEIWFLTGRNHWYQTAFCAWTLAKHSRHRIRPVILDDGTLEDSQISQIRRIFPQTVVHRKTDCDARVDALLPREEFPNIRRWRDRQLLFRKLTDIHAGSSEWRLFLDSDMLFFAPPVAIDDYLDNPSGCIVQADCWESYGYSRTLVESLCGHTLPKAANIGIFSLNGDSIPWKEVDGWLAKMEEAEGTRYNVTQCTSAMLMSGLDYQILDKEDYKVHPVRPGPSHTPRILEHYVSDSKPWYLGKAWRTTLS